MELKILEIFYFNSDPKKFIQRELVQQIADLVQVATRVVEVCLSNNRGQKITIFAPEDNRSSILGKIDELYNLLPKGILITIM